MADPTTCSYCGATMLASGNIEHHMGCLTTEMFSEGPDRPPRPSWGSVYSQFAQVLSKRSTCSRLQVGCVVVSSDNQRVLAIGYNGNWQGGPNACDSSEPGNCRCIHAETNALVKLDYNDPFFRVMYATDSPCVACAKLIINARIGHVVYDREYRITDGIELLKRAKVHVERL